MFHETHTAVTGPALFVIVPNYIFIVGIRILGKVSLDQISRFLLRESEYKIEFVNVSAVKTNGVPRLSF